MRIAILLDDLSGGGVERTMLTLADGFLKHGHAVDVVLGRRTGPLEGELPAGARVVVLDAQPGFMARLAIVRADPGGLSVLAAAGVVRPAEASRPNAAASAQPRCLPPSRQTGRSRLGQVPAEPVRGLGARSRFGADPPGADRTDLADRAFSNRPVACAASRRAGAHAPLLSARRPDRDRGARSRRRPRPVRQPAARADPRDPQSRCGRADRCGRARAARPSLAGSG